MSDKRPPPVVDRWVWDVVAISLSSIAGGFAAPSLSVWRPYVAADAGAAYAGIVGLHAALLGFVLAALSITAGYAQSDRFLVVRQSGKLSDLYGIYIAAAVTELVGLCLALVALLTRLPEPGRTALTFAVGGITVLALLRLARTIWITSVVVRATATPSIRAPGEA